MSMILYVARGDTGDLERLADRGGEDGSMPPAFEAMMSRQQAKLASMTPESLAQLETALRAIPQLGAMGPQLMERLRTELAARVGVQSSGSAGGDRQSAATATARTESIDLHKSWHILHFLLSGREAGGGVAPSNFLMEGGREIGDDQGYGAARLLDAEETAAFARFTNSLTVAALKERIDAPRMAALGIYCVGGPTAADAAEIEEDVEHYFPMLQAHFEAAAQAGQSTLVWLT